MIKQLKYVHKHFSNINESQKLNDRLVSNKCQWMMTLVYKTEGGGVRDQQLKKFKTILRAQDQDKKLKHLLVANILFSSDI